MWPFNEANYPAFFLFVYDAWVLHTVTPLVWRCSTKEVLLPLYQRNVDRHHCDIGCGSGYYLVHNTYTPESTITLLDIEPAPLSSTTTRLHQSHPTLPVHAHQHDILSPSPIPPPPPPSSLYDSISLTYLLHTLPASTATKASVFEKLKPAIAPSGVIFGATILGRGAWHSFLGRGFLRWLNWKWLDNYDDRPEVFVDALRENFKDVKCEIVGSVLIFEAREPIV
ncbi:hypothetical protein BO94DRAFT_531085 [Aspergillus sclerotioniger CBS 115572]|uniref:Methyltransferase type 12 domain-containing protein n=1 Tax=Aspergillus sclerotioniger CBS 115572 TaxID=1450535 RepID=A0A317X9C7_9EURO|nr:hypothetical protein BO94DRAFT_531085 [Aspergillus sclerotioniger CBS 115572]PWY95176.1 hypothetical protein BO94DRAFT_531085 [Aspergillus sclerotioniger CBS 115572]